MNKANLRDLKAATGLIILLNLDSFLVNFSACMTTKLAGRNKTIRAPPLKLCQALSIISKPSVKSNWIYRPEMLNLSKIWQFFVLCDLEIWQMTLKNKRASLPCHFKLCASFLSHQQFQTGATVRKRQFRVKIGNFSSHVTLTFDGWPCKPTGQLSYATSWFVHHFTTIGSFQLKFPFRNTQFGSKVASSSSRKYVTCGLETLTLHQRGNAANNRAPNNSYCHSLGVGCCCGCPWCAAWAGFSVRELTPAWSPSMWRGWKWFFVLTMGIHTFSTGRGMDCDGFRFSGAVSHSLIV